MKPYTLADAEADLRRAIDDNQAGAIAGFGRIVDDLDQRPQVSLEAAALWYAQQGLHVFPLSPGSKIPFKGTGGFKDATTDDFIINAWWGEHPDANIGIATGHLVDVIDIDGLPGQTSRLAHWDMLTAIPDLGCVSTPRPGGMHIYVPATGRGNKAGLLPGIDYRGAGGYVVAPPSTNDQGRYTWLAPLDLPRLEADAA